MGTRPTVTNSRGYAPCSRKCSEQTLPSLGVQACVVMREGRMDDILRLLRDNISAVFTLLGVVVGSLLSFLSTSALRMREARLRVTEKIIDERIQAHEEIARWATSLSKGYGVGYYKNAERTSVFAPTFMLSSDKFGEWTQEFRETWDRCGFWISAGLHRELDLFLAYVVELSNILADGYPENSWVVGVMIYEDFPAFRVEIRNQCYRYVTSDAFMLRVSPQRVTLAPKAETDVKRKRKLAHTVLFSQRERIEKLAHTDPNEVEKMLNFSVFDHFRKQYLAEDEEVDRG
jgi:hypothetical protein